METLNIVVLNIIFLIGPACGFIALKKIAVHFSERETIEQK